MRISKKKKGFTLIEVIAVAAIIGIVMLMVGNFFSTTINIYIGENINTQIQSDARSVLNNITQDIRNAYKIKCGSGYLSLTNHDGSIINYNLDTTKNELYCGGRVISKNITNINFYEDSKTNNLIIYLNAQKKGNEKTYNLSSSVDIGKKASIKPSVQPSDSPEPYDDLINYEKNMLNIINPTDTNTNISFTNTTFNPQDKSSVLIQGNSVKIMGLGNNLQGNMAIKADTIDLGNGQFGTASNYDIIFDGKNLVGTLASYNSKFYVQDGLVKKNDKFNKISSYKDGFWKYLFEKEGDSTTRNMAIRTLKDNINFNDTTINPNQEINSKIHYFDGKVSNGEMQTIDNNLSLSLPDYNGKKNVCMINSSSYEYIICHGPLKICTSSPNARNFNFKGLIYCDDEIIINDLDSNFKGIIIAKSLIVKSNEQRNWNVGFDNNGDGALDNINKILSNIVKTSN